MNTPDPAAGAAATPPVLRILIVDDDEVDRLRVTRMLRRAPDWRVAIDTAPDVAAGLAALRARSFDCVLLDYRLPDGEGPDLLRALSAAGGERPPIILQTVFDEEETAVAALAQGAQDYLVKGRFDGEGLCRAIRYAMQRDRLLKEKDRLVRELQAALGQVKTLQGLLPTCAWCNRIKDEQGAWLPFETYIARHSDAQFTHGICPECLKRHSAEFTPSP